jgi:hypothetical protein
LGLIIRGLRLVPCHHGAGLRLHQLLGAIQLDGGEHLRALAAFQRALGLLHRGLEESLLDTVERIALLHEVAFLELHLFEKTLDARDDLHAVDGLDAPDEVERLGDRLALGHDSPDRNSGRRSLLSNCRRCQRKKHHA